MENKNAFINKMKKFSKLVLVIWVLLVNIPVYACTVFYVSKNDKILVGSNKDWITTDAYILFYPAEEGKYGNIRTS
jgi:penicillin V acylase-like amidase (Ntn superfamily)